MEYAVIYYSKTGNTEKVAREIYEALDTEDKELINLSEAEDIPEADMYFVGFPIQNQSCGIKIMDCLEQIEVGKLVLFATCGMKPTSNYKNKLEDALSVWISDSVEYKGMFLCQGETAIGQRKVFIEAKPEYASEIAHMMDVGMGHPDDEDLQRTAQFTKQICSAKGYDF